MSGTDRAAGDVGGRDLLGSEVEEEDEGIGDNRFACVANKTL
jgi:hypothetical protein